MGLGAFVWELRERCIVMALLSVKMGGFSGMIDLEMVCERVKST